MADNRITKSRVRNHLTYSWWKYLAAVITCAILGNLYFTMTAYRPPADRKIELYVVNDLVDQLAMEEDFWPVLKEACPEQELFSVLNVNMTSEDPYVRMQFSTYIAAQQGDVFLLPEKELLNMVEAGPEDVFLELTPYVENGTIDPQDIDLETGRFPDTAGNRGLYAIPADSLYGLLNFGNNPRDSYLCVMAYSGNPDTAAKTIGLMLERYRTEKPEGLEEKPQEVAAPIF